jgi:transcriptional regulator with XRE-family HTH domain
MATTQHARIARPPLHGVRVARGLSLREAARRAGIDPGHLSKFERGEERLGIDNLLRLARVLGVEEMVKTLEPYAKEATNE